MRNIEFVNTETNHVEIWGGGILLARAVMAHTAKHMAINALRDRIADLWINPSETLDCDEKAVYSLGWAVLARELFEVET